MALLHGKRGSITLGGVAFHITAWTLNYETEAVEVTNTGSPAPGMREYISGLSGGSGTFDAVHDDTNPLPEVFSRAEFGELAAIVLNLGDATDTISGNAIITAMEWSSSVEGRVEVSASYQLTGAITLPS